ncbi:MAG TPA: PAS domain S-box protein [Polyangiaceae bacterium]|nr:PAS domain S-box protein [Polyangiaceae bacterium]
MDASQGGDSRGDLAERVAALEAMLAERLDMVQTLRESEERLRTLLENAPDSITVIDERGTLLYLNRTVASRRLEDVVGTNVVEYMGPGHGEQFLEKVRAVIATGVPELVEVETRTEHRWYATRLVPLRRSGRVVAVMGIGADVTEQRRAEAALRRSEEMLRLAVQSARMGLWAWDVEADSFTLDPVSGRMLGYEGEVIGATLTEIIARVAPSDRARAAIAARQFAEKGEISDFEFRVTLPDGAERFLVASGRRADGSALLIGGAFDVTERRRLEEQLRQAQKMEAVGQLTAGIAHNFNNLLTAIIPSVQLARRSLPGAAGERLQDAEYAASRAAELVKQLMLFARHRRRPEKARVDVRTLVARTVGICRATFDSSIELSITEAPDVPPVFAEAGEIEQVLLNVYLNARDAFEDAKSEQRLIATHVDVVRIPTPHVRVRVADTGPGMPESVRSRVFEPFFTTKEVGRGTGLGLATAYAIAADHEGKLTCDSIPGEGSVFTLFLPVPDASTVPSAERRGRAKETILVLDDERMVRRAVRSILEPAGYEVLEAVDGAEGFELFQRNRGRVDLVLLDLSMPGIPAEAVLTSILRERPSTRVVLFTGQRPEKVPIGVAAVLQKPVRVEELLRVVREVCDRNGAPPTGLT